MILVTGGAGMVGKEIISQLLSEGNEVTAIYNTTPLPDFGSDKLKQFHCDILDVKGLAEVMQGIEKIYHCAAIVSFYPKRKYELFKVNIEGTANIVNAALYAGVKKIAHISSIAALGRLRKNETINEKMKWSEETNNSQYAKSKHLSEMEIWRGIAEGLQAVIVNPAIILGAGDWEKGSSKLFKTVYDGFPWYSTGTSGFVDARDVARAMILLMNSDINGERFILSAENRTYGDVLKLMADAFGKKQPYRKVTPLIANIAWRLEAIRTMITGKEPLVTKETSSSALSKVYYDNSKLLQFLPEFTYRTIEETIKETCEQLIKKYNLK